MVQSYMQGKGEKGVLEQNCTVEIFLKNISGSTSVGSFVPFKITSSVHIICLILSRIPVNIIKN